MWPPISTPNHGKISYSKDAKDYEEKDETTNYIYKKKGPATYLKILFKV